jgi:hypothetical protein
MNKSTFVGALAVLVAISPFGRAQVNQKGGNAPGDFTIERVLTISSVSAPTAPNFPPPVLAAFQKGTIEIHQIFVYNSAQRTLEQSALVVPGNSPLPFPSPGSAPVGDHYIIQVDSASTTSSPSASAVLVGHVISNDVPTPFGDITGAIVTLSFGFQGSGPATRFGPIYESVSPLYGLYTVTGVGSLSLTPTPQACSNATLNGTYMFELRGSVQTGPSSFGPYADIGRIFADGQGKITVIHAANINGNVSTDSTFLITYALDQLCSGTFQWPGASMNVLVSKDGQRVNMVFTSPSSVVASGIGVLQ